MISFLKPSFFKSSFFKSLVKFKQVWLCSSLGPSRQIVSSCENDLEAKNCVKDVDENEESKMIVHEVLERMGMCGDWPRISIN